MENYTETNPLYADALERWQLVEDCVKGSQAVKKRKQEYLPKPNDDLDQGQTAESQAEYDSNSARYSQYLLRAMFYNTCYRTESGLVGSVFRKRPMAELPSDVDYLLDNADGSGLTLTQQAQYVVSEVLKKGRVALLADMPVTDGDVSRAQMQAGVSPNIIAYDAKSVVDWNECATPTGCKLNYVKIEEFYQDLDIDTGDRTEVKRWRVLRLRDGVYTSQITYQDGAGKADEEEIVPRPKGGTHFDFIPFIFCGSRNNSSDIDPAPLYDLAEVNIGHYRNSADNEEASFICGQPTLAMTSDMSSDEFATANPNGVVIGSRRGHFLGAGGNMFLVQAESTGLPRQLMLDKQDQMLSLGAQLVTPNTQQTATATNADTANTTSVLGLAVGNVSAAYEKVIGWAAMFLSSAEQEVKYKLNQDFFPDTFDAQEVTAWMAGVQGGLIPKSAFNNKMREAGVTQLDDDEIQAEVELLSDNLDLSEPVTDA
tara:strand:+ start:13 stop:1464 length:1452 start_codon:yes stop_codon:yes gene_type:complete